MKVDELLGGELGAIPYQQNQKKKLAMGVKLVQNMNSNAENFITEYLEFKRMRLIDQKKT